MKKLAILCLKQPYWALLCAAMLQFGSVLVPPAWAGEKLLVDDFTSGSLRQWRSRDFEGKTRYQIVEMDGKSVLKAYTFQSGSALYRELQVDLLRTPVLHWSWRVDQLYSIADQQLKAGDDFPARIYVVVKTGPFPWQTRALNYVWSNHAVQQPFWPNPFTEKAMMLAVRSGAAGLGQWHSEAVNIRNDYHRVFGQWIEHIDGIAIMSDSDNAGGEATAFYGPIYFQSESEATSVAVPQSKATVDPLDG